MSEPIAWTLVGLLAITTLLLLRRRGESMLPRPTAVSRRPEEPLERAIVDRAREGILVLNQSMNPVMANAAARSMLGLAAGGLPATMRSDELESLARRAMAEQQTVEAEITLWPRRLTVRVRALPLPDPDGIALFLDDVTQDTRLQQVRRQFVVNASHELKTPVTGLLALGEAIGGALPGDVEAAERLTQQLIREAERLTKLTQDLLDLSRVEDPASLRTGRVGLDEVVQYEVARLKELADDRRVLMEITSGPVGVYVAGDEQQLGLMIRNLVDNAIRYSEPGGHVQVAVGATDGEATITVTDDGIGIPLRDQARVFERFYRVDEGRGRSSGGTGLGLSIVRHVAESHGGHVSLESELGEGSRFVVRLPLAEDASR